MKTFLNQLFTLFCWASIAIYANAQSYLSYYLPEGLNYSKSIPHPEEVIGFPIGEWHLSYDQMLLYAKTVAEKSDRIALEYQGKTYEGRPTSLLIVTHPDNHKKLDQIREEHLMLSDPARSKNLSVENMPVVVWMGYSVHGNEASGFNSVPLWLYYLAAAQSEKLDEQLRNTVLLIEPCINPDGATRFASWVNMHKSHTAVTDPQAREFDETWPGGRTNHYWFDLNRDWLPVQHPESKARIANYQKWRPNVLTDHHEMGTNSTFFFQPGIPSRKNPLTPIKNVELTEKIAQYHAARFDSIGSLYYSEESFDDFYYGKGSTYPDVQGSVGILFEQASSRGHGQESIHGVLTFPFTIKNQLNASFSTFDAVNALRKELLTYQKEFYLQSVQEAEKDPVKGYVFSAEKDPMRTFHFLELLKAHSINFGPLNEDAEIEGEHFKKGESYFVNLSQPQFKLIKALFYTQTSFQDSLFYDISTWTMPLAFGLQYKAVGAKELSKMKVGEVQKTISLPKGSFPNKETEVGYAFHWNGYYAPRALYRLLKENVLVKVASKPWIGVTEEGSERFGYGSIFIPVGLQKQKVPRIVEILEVIAEQDGIDIVALASGQALQGPDLGSGMFEPLTLPKVAIMAGEGVTSYEAGEVWHLFDQRYKIPLTLLKTENLSRTDLSRYNVLIMVDGSYQISGNELESIKRWVREGNTLVVTKSATKWAASNGLSKVEWKSRAEEAAGFRPYASHREDRGAQRIGGAIFKVQADLSHPLCYGFTRSEFPVFRNHTLFAEPPKGPYATPVRYTESPLMSGYISNENKAVIGGTAVIWVNSSGRGKVVSMLDNPNFRAFWYGTNKLFANAVFFGSTISGSSTR